MKRDKEEQTWTIWTIHAGIMFKGILIMLNSAIDLMAIAISHHVSAGHDWTHRKSNADRQFFSLHHIHKERYDRHQDRRACPQKIEHDRVQPRLDQPFDFDLPRVHRAADPLVFPCEELDKLDLIYPNPRMKARKRQNRRGRRTAPINSFSTAILPSRAAMTPF